MTRLALLRALWGTVPRPVRFFCVWGAVVCVAWGLSQCSGGVSQPPEPGAAMVSAAPTLAPVPQPRPVTVETFAIEDVDRACRPRPDLRGDALRQAIAGCLAAQEAMRGTRDFVGGL